MSTHYVSSRRMSCRRGVTVLLAVMFAFFMVLHPGAVLAEEDDTTPAGEAGLGVGSGLLTLVYFPMKVVYAVLGSVVGGFTYVLTGGDLDTAKTVWDPSIYGTYVITPEHLKGNKAVRFYGVSPYEDEQ